MKFSRVINFNVSQIVPSYPFLGNSAIPLKLIITVYIHTVTTLTACNLVDLIC